MEPRTNKKRHPILCPNIAAERLYFENYMNHFEARYCKKKFQKMRKKSENHICLRRFFQDPPLILSDDWHLKMFLEVLEFFSVLGFVKTHFSKKLFRIIKV